jgi:uncharacterized membrane protein
MYWILFVMSAIVAVVVALIVGGLATPRDHAVARAIALPVASETVWTTIRDLDRYDEWRHQLDSVQVVDTDQPQPRWRETTSRGSITFGITMDEPPHRMTARILDDDLPFTGEWNWSVEPTSDGTRVVITERGRVANPVFRFISAHFLGHTRSIDRYLKELAARHGTPHIDIQDARAV